jgi:predicted NodU family carbamoyl transferase
MPAIVQAPLAPPGGPLANSPADAVTAFTALGLDALVVDRVVLLKDLA